MNRVLDVRISAIALQLGVAALAGDHDVRTRILTQ